jgi:predicted ATPase
MPDPSTELANRWRDASRFANFGSVILSLSVKGVRCHTDTTITIQSPITAFSGLNGTGKTTLLQLAAALYKSDQQFNVSSFLAKGPLDVLPFQDDASVKTTLQTQRNGPTPLTLSYNPTSKRWQGYGRRQERGVYFFGVGFFLPLNEKRDFVFRNAQTLSIAATVEVEESIRTRCGRILSIGYDRLLNVSVKHRNQTADVLSTTRGATSYSEAHMGCGEGRIHCLVRTLESVPPKSLILLEEPEISLHQRAEYELGKYLIDLSRRRGHQILLTTHSERLLRALPQASLVHLTYHNNSIKPVSGLLSSQAESLMSEGFDHALVVIVEDEAAEIVLSELMRAHDPHFLSTVRIAIAGLKRSDGQIEASGSAAIIQAIKTFSSAGLKVAVVLDGNELQWWSQDPERDSEEQRAMRALPIFKLPGTRPPEEEVLDNLAARAVLSSPPYGLNAVDVSSRLASGNCHDYIPELSRLLSCHKRHLLTEMARAYASTVPHSVRKLLIEQLKESC